jgi:phosphoserine phosphatase RsbU/P
VPPASVLVADDQPHVVDALRLLLKPEGYQIDTADSPRALLASLRRRSYDVVLMDLNYARDTTSGREGLDLIGGIRETDTLTPIVVMTAWSTVTLAVEAMQRGAHDFVQKPWDNTRLLTIIRTQTEFGRASRLAAQCEARQRQDLELAAQVQQHLLPRACPEFQTLECAARCRPAGIVGGDYFDFIRIDGEHTALAIGDVAGKGVAAALLMTSLQALLRSRAAACASDVSQLAVETNQRLQETIPGNKYATLFYGVYSDAQRALTYINAGHNPPLLLRTDGAIERLSAGGPVLGMFENAVYGAATVQLDRGDRLVLYTDGVTEALNEAGDEFGEARLIDAIAGCPHTGAQATEAAILAAHSAFTRETARADDMTLVVATVR